MTTWLEELKLRLRAFTLADEAPAVASSPRWRISRLGLLRLALLLSSLALLFGPALIQHIRLSANPYVFNDDARQQIYPFLRYADPQLFPDDLPARYYLDAYPPGYRLLYTWLAYVVNPVTVSKVLPYLLLVVLLVAVGLASFRLAGWIAAWFSLIFCLSSPYFLARLAGGLPRAFGLAILACAIAALVYGRMRGLALCTVLSAAFYAPVAVVCGLALALNLLILPSHNRGSATAWSLKQRLGLVGLTLLLCIVVLVPTTLKTRAYGRILRPADVTSYPELGVNGRYGPEDRAPFDPLPIAMFKMLPEAFRGRELSWVPGLYDWVATIPHNLWHMPLYQWLMLGLALVLCAGFAVAARQRSEARRVGALVFATCSVYLIAQPVAPYLYLPQRYTAYAIPLLAVIWLPVAVRTLAEAAGRLGRQSWAGPGVVVAVYGVDYNVKSKIGYPLGVPKSKMGSAAVVAVCGVCYLLTGGQGHSWAGLGTIPAADLPLYQFAATLPKAARLAAWPSEIANNIPYLSHREILISPEIHQVFHQGYADEMRRRMRALIDAYYATDAAPLVALRDQFGVRYLIVDERYFTVPIRYFQPFDTWSVAAWRQLQGDPHRAEVVRQMPQATVFRDGAVVVLDLLRVSAAQQQSGSSGNTGCCDARSPTIYRTALPVRSLVSTTEAVDHRQPGRH